jgi:hypothetical protein
MRRESDPTVMLGLVLIYTAAVAVGLALLVWLLL